jgi:hypothetical protein
LLQQVAYALLWALPRSSGVPPSRRSRIVPRCKCPPPATRLDSITSGPATVDDALVAYLLKWLLLRTHVRGRRG